MNRLLRITLAAALAFSLQLNATHAQEAGEKIASRSMSSVVTILTGTGSGVTEKLGTGIVIRADGVILTAYHVIKDANQVQVRLKNGEIFDKVDLLGFDERRDVAAIRIQAANLSPAEIFIEEPAAGQKIFVVSNPRALTWSVSDGVVSGVRMADEVQGAGRGFRVIQFSAPVSAGSSGGLLIDENGRALGLVVSTLASGQNLNFAIPLSSVTGLASASVISSFGRGTSLELPQTVREPNTADMLKADPSALLKNAKFFYIYSYSDLINDQMMENALMKLPEFKKWGLVIVKDQKLADVTINVEHDLFTWNYRYSMTDRRTSILLASGKVTAWDGRIASGKFAKEVIKALSPGREPVKK